MRTFVRPLVWVCVFGITFGLVEASVVVYLRSLYYPDGFTFPLRLVNRGHLMVELMREAATIGMLVAVAALAGKRRWEQFGFFVIAFGVWDIFYYVWLKVFLDWPAAITDWDVLFLLPLPWIGPVLAPVLISVLMIACGILLLGRLHSAKHFAPTIVSWSLGILGTVVVLYSFVYDVDARLHMALPQPYRYSLLIAGLVLYMLSFWTSCRVTSVRKQ